MLAGLCFEFICVTPLPRYRLIRPGMSASEIHRILGEPQDPQRDLKGVEIWIRRGILLETCFAVSYSDRAQPDRATKATLWMRKKIISSNKARDCVKSLAE